ncbi:MAG: heat-inducible transcriptional repressor HrcA [Candidatus Aminicenantales bacterium]
MGIAELREKDKLIFKIISENYLKLGKPISSGYIAQKSRLPLSPATIRNIMARLEKEGLLYQPHTSAGRIPTDRGLRFYVNSLFEEAVLPHHMKLDSEEFSLERGDFNSLLIRVSKVLSEYSDNLGFVLSPRVSRMNFHHLRFIRISDEKVMAILITTSNLVLTEIVETNEYFTQLELDKASNYLNQNFKGKSLVFIRNYLMRELPKYKLRYEHVLNKLISLVRAYIFQEEEGNQIFLQGTSKFLEKPDFRDLERLRSLFQNFEEKARLARLLSDFISLDRVKVLIGSELNLPEASDCALILSHYGYDNQVLGSLGIIGPKRIPYKKIIPLVDSVATKLSKTISSSQ